MRPVSRSISRARHCSAVPSVRGREVRARRLQAGFCLDSADRRRVSQADRGDGQLKQARVDDRASHAMHLARDALCQAGSGHSRASPRDCDCALQIGVGQAGNQRFLHLLVDVTRPGIAVQVHMAACQLKSLVCPIAGRRRCRTLVANRRDGLGFALLKSATVANTASRTNRLPASNPRRSADAPAGRLPSGRWPDCRLGPPGEMPRTVASAVQRLVNIAHQVQ